MSSVPASRRYLGSGPHLGDLLVLDVASVGDALASEHLHRCKSTMLYHAVMNQRSIADDVTDTWARSMVAAHGSVRARAESTTLDRAQDFMDALARLSEYDAYAGLSWAHFVLDQLQSQVVPDLVRFCREDGETWEAIGTALGTSKQNAFRKWRYIDDDIAADAEAASA